MICVLLISSCGEEGNKRYIESDDGLLVAEIVSKEIWSGVHVTVRVGTLLQKQNKELVEVFEGVSLGSDIFWLNNDVLIIGHCRGNIFDIKSSIIIEERALLVHIQVVTVPKLALKDRIVC